MYEEVSRAPNHFSVVLFLRRCKSTVENKAKQCFSHNFPEKPTILGKIGLFLGKIKGQLSQHWKIKKKSQNINKKPIKHPLFYCKPFPTLSPKNCCFSEKEWLKKQKIADLGFCFEFQVVVAVVGFKWRSWGNAKIEDLRSGNAFNSLPQKNALMSFFNGVGSCFSILHRLWICHAALIV